VIVGPPRSEGRRRRLAVTLCGFVRAGLALNTFLFMAIYRWDRLNNAARPDGKRAVQAECTEGAR
jgi:hypothetical protein